MEGFLKNSLKADRPPRLLPVLFLSFACLVDTGLVGCQSVTGRDTPTETQTPKVALDQEFRLQFGQAVEIQVEQLTIAFVSLVNDSRCPADVTCVWEGDAEILLQVRQADAQAASIPIHTNRKFPHAKQYRQYVIQLVALDPYPRTDREKKPENYVATLLVKKE